MRQTTLRSFRLLLLPLERLWRATNESVRCKNRVERWWWWQMRQVTEVKIALNSKQLICSGWPRQAQPVTTFHFQRREGTEARYLWYLTICEVGVLSKMSSPLMLTRFAIFCTRRLGSPAVTRVRSGRKGGRNKRLWSRVCPVEGRQLITS